MTKSTTTSGDIWRQAPVHFSLQINRSLPHLLILREVNFLTISFHLNNLVVLTKPVP